MNKDETYSLYHLLKDSYGNEFEAIIELDDDVYEINGRLHNEWLHIVYVKDSILTITTYVYSKYIALELNSILKKAMDDVNPLCSYELHDANDKSIPPVHITEWDLENPRKRLKEIKNHIGFPSYLKVSNFIMYSTNIVRDNNIINFEEYKNSRK